VGFSARSTLDSDSIGLNGTFLKVDTPYGVDYKQIATCVAVFVVKPVRAVAGLAPPWEQWFNPAEPGVR